MTNVINFPFIFFGGYVTDETGISHWQVPLVAAESRNKKSRRSVICSVRLCDHSKSEPRLSNEYATGAPLATTCAACADLTFKLPAREPKFDIPLPGPTFTKWRYVSRRELDRYVRERSEAQNPKGKLNERD